MSCVRADRGTSSATQAPQTAGLAGQFRRRLSSAHNGHQALDKALKALPDLILTDIAVPGIELCRRIRADARTRAIPLLAITGYEDRYDVDRALLAGADCVLTKPCDAERPVSEARRLLDQFPA